MSILPTDAEARSAARDAVFGALYQAGCDSRLADDAAQGVSHLHVRHPSTAEAVQAARCWDGRVGRWLRWGDMLACYRWAYMRALEGHSL